MKSLRISVPYKILAIFGPDPIGDNGKEEVIYYCPECINRKGSPDTKGKLYVNTKTYKYNCFRCGYCGQIGYKVKINEDQVYEEDKDKDIHNIIDSINSLSNDTHKFSLKIPIDKVTTSNNATKYLLDRGFTYQQFEYYDLRVGNLNNEFGRIIIPNQVDHLVYTDFYSARTYIDQTPKYHNPGKAKSSTVFNLHRQKEGDPIIVVEGALTAIAAGYHAVATLGKTITVNQASMIAKKHPSIIYINYDYGAEEFSHKACKILKDICPDTPIYEVLMPDERDAADLSHLEYTERLKSANLYKPLYDDIMDLIMDNNV